MNWFERASLKQLVDEWELKADLAKGAAREPYRVCAENLRAALARLPKARRTALVRRASSLLRALDRERSA